MNEIASNILFPTKIYRHPLRVGEIARLVGVCNKTVLNWIYRGALNAFQTCGGHWRVAPQDFNEFLRNRKMNIQFKYKETA